MPVGEAPINEGSVLSPDGFELAFGEQAGAAPAVMFLPGFNSVMTGSKATYLERWCARVGHRYVRFDYRGHGASGGRLEDGGVEQWYRDAAFIYEHLDLNEVVLVGASMGGWIALLLARHLGQKLRGVVGIGAAVDFTLGAKERLTPEQAQALARTGITYRPSRYGDGPYPLTARMLEEGNRHCLLGKGLTLPCPLHLFHGLDDPDLPWAHALEIARGIEAVRLEVTLVAQGDHRLSRPADLDAVGVSVGRMLRRDAPVEAFA